MEEAIDSIEALLKAGRAKEVIELSEFALQKAEEAILHMDDSDGHMGIIFDRLQTLHPQACKKAKPDPETLARRLFGWELQGESDIFYGAADTYSKILGKHGLALYRKLAEAEWQKIKPLPPNGDEMAGYDGNRFRITHIMQTLAKQAGDVEALVAILSRNLSSAYSFLQIAETYKKDRKYKQALDWAERGLKAFTKNSDRRLQEFVADEYHRLRRHDEAMQLIWQLFTAHPHLESYISLKQHAKRAKQWPDWRKQALDHLYKLVKKESVNKNKDHFYIVYGYRDKLVEIYLWEKDPDTAWELSQQGTLNKETWLKLVTQREKKHPEDAIRIYKTLIGPTVEKTDNAAYKEAVVYLKQIRNLMKKTNQKKTFRTYLNNLREFNSQVQQMG